MARLMYHEFFWSYTRISYFQLEHQHQHISTQDLFHILVIERKKVDQKNKQTLNKIEIEKWEENV